MLRPAYPLWKHALLLWKHALLLGALAAGFGPLTAYAQTPPHSPPSLVKTTTPRLFPPASHSKNMSAVTVMSVGSDTVHVMLADGTGQEASVKSGSVFLVNGKMVMPSEFPVGGHAWLRTRTRASDGTLSVVLLSDAASEAALDMYRRQELTGRIVSRDDKTLVVKPNADAGGAVVSLHLTAKTVFRHNGAVSEVSAFALNASVAVQTRSLPSGLLMASVVSDSDTDLAKEKAARKTTGLSGSVSAVDLDKQLLRITPKTKPGMTVAVAQSTRIKVRKREGTLKDITAGMHVSARLSAQQDSEGHLVAASLSAYDAPLPMARKKAVVGKKTP